MGQRSGALCTTSICSQRTLNANEMVALTIDRMQLWQLLCSLHGNSIGACIVSRQSGQVRASAILCATLQDGHESGVLRLRDISAEASTRAQSTLHARQEKFATSCMP